METEKLLREYLSTLGLDIDLDEIDLSDFGQFLEEKGYAIKDKISCELLD